MTTTRLFLNRTRQHLFANTTKNLLRSSSLPMNYFPNFKISYSYVASPAPQFYLQQRFFATDKDLFKQFKHSQINRMSVPDPRAAKLITAIRDKDYELAKRLVFVDKVDVNSHDVGENTALTDAARRGDTEGVRKLLTDLNANPHSSCDCPHHKTGLHYAAENGHHVTVAEFLKQGANPNVLDSRKYTALDVAKTEMVRQVLIKNGGSCGKQIAEDKVNESLKPPRLIR